jgi:HD superfamily phosphohydrolase YqeK
MTAGRDPRLPSWAEVSPEREAHIARVAGLAEEWAARMEVSDQERARWLRAVWLHDALRDAGAATLDRWAPDTPGLGELRHGPASASRAAAEGEADCGVLDAVRYHSVGHSGWDMVGRVLYCADFLEPGRGFDREHRAVLAGRFPEQPARVLAAVATERLVHLVNSGWPLPEPTVRFWNSLVDSSGTR